MKSYTKEELHIVLILTPSEAKWVKTLIQNPLNVTGDPTLENPRDREMRKLFWHELSKYNL